MGEKGEVGEPASQLDEVDKLGADYQGDPCGAAGCWIRRITPPTIWKSIMTTPMSCSEYGQFAEYSGLLLDRMEVIRIAGYTEDEKIEIARQHLRRLIRPRGAAAVALMMTGVAPAIRVYTREAGNAQPETRAASLAQGQPKSSGGNRRRCHRR